MKAYHTYCACFINFVKMSFNMYFKGSQKLLERFHSYFIAKSQGNTLSMSPQGQVNTVLSDDDLTMVGGYR